MASPNIGTENNTGITIGMPFRHSWTILFTTDASATYQEGDLDDWTFRLRLFNEEHSTTTVYDQTNSNSDWTVTLSGSTTTAQAVVLVNIDSVSTGTLSRNIKAFYRFDVLDAEGELQYRIQGKAPIDT